VPEYVISSATATTQYVAENLYDTAETQWQPDNHDDRQSAPDMQGAFRGMLWQMTANIASHTFSNVFEGYADAAEVWQHLLRTDAQALSWDALLRQTAEGVLHHDALLPAAVREPARESAQFILRFADFYQDAVTLFGGRELTDLLTRYADILPQVEGKAAQDLLFILQNADHLRQGTLPQRLHLLHDILGHDLLQSLPLVSQLRANVATIIRAAGYWQMAETLWESTSQISASNAPLTEKLTRIAALLLRQRALLPAEWQSAIDIISQTQRQVADLLAQPGDSDISMLIRARQVMQSLSDLVNTSVISALLPAVMRDSIDGLLRQGRLIVGALDGLFSTESTQGFEAYLAQTLALSDALAPELLAPLRALATQIRAVIAPMHDSNFPAWPEPASPAAVLNWLQQILMQPAFHDTVLPLLPEGYRQALTSALHLSQQAGTFPVQGATGEQLQWLIRQVQNPDLRQLMAQAGLEPYLKSLTSQLSGDLSAELFAVFLQVINPEQSLSQRLGKLVSGLFRRGALSEAVSQGLGAGLRWLPGGQVLAPLWRLGVHWYQRTLLAPTWAETLHNFLQVVQDDLSGNVLVMDLVAHLTGVMPPSAAEAMRTLHTIHAFQLQRDLTTPDDTLRWVLSGMQHYPELQAWYQNYLNLTLVWSVKKILDTPDVRLQQQEVAHLQARLAEPEWRVWPGVGQLSALLPLLPLLPAIREELGDRTLPTGHSWLEWSGAVADILAASEHPALRQLRQQLEQNIETWISETLLQGVAGAAQTRLLTSRRLPESWSSAGMSHEGMQVEGDVYISGGEWFIRDEGRMYRVEPDTVPGVLRLIKPGETHASGGSPRIVREDGRWRIDLRPAAGLPGGSPGWGAEMAGGIVRLSEHDMDWLASEETQRVAKVATGVGLGIWWLGTLYAFWRSYHQGARTAYHAAPQEVTPAEPEAPSHETAARLLNRTTAETVLDIDEPQRTEATGGRWQRAGRLGRQYAVPLGMTALGAISSAAYLQWVLRNPEQESLTEEDLTALRTLLAQRHDQIVIDMPVPDKAALSSRTGQRRLLADEAPVLSPQHEKQQRWPPLPRLSAIDAALEQKVREIFPPPGTPEGFVADYKAEVGDEKLYLYNGLRYVFIADSYRYIDLYINSPRGITARLYPAPSLYDEDNASLSVVFKPEAQKWFLNSSESESSTADVTTEETEATEATEKITRTSASMQLTKLAGAWQADKAFQYTQMVPGQEGEIYQDDKLYIFLHGQYWPFTFVSDDIGAINYGAGRAYVRRSQEQWDMATTLRPMPMPGASVVSPAIEERVEKEFDPSKAWQPAFGDFITSKEKGIYNTASGNETCIYVATNFWPIVIQNSDSSSGPAGSGVIYEKPNDSTAKKIFIFKDRARGLWEDLDQTPTKGTRERPKNTTASAWLLEEARLWDIDITSKDFNPSLEGSGGIYRQPNGDLYIYLNKSWWPFVLSGGNIGVIAVKKNGKPANVVVHNYNGVWEYAGESQVETPLAISDFLEKLMINTTLGKETRLALFQALAGHDFISWNMLLQLLMQIIDQEFFRLYTQPDNEKLKEVILLKGKIARMQQQMRYVEPLPSVTSKNEWNNALLDTYYNAFSTGLIDATDIYAAWHSRQVSQDVANKKKTLEGYNVQQKLNEVRHKLKETDADLQRRMQDIKDRVVAPAGEEPITLAKAAQEKFHILLSKRDQLEKIADNINAKIANYNKQISFHNEKYHIYDQGLSLAKKTLGHDLLNADDKSKASLATEQAIMTLALQEVSIVIKERAAYTEKELEDLKTIRIARDLVIRMSEQQSAFHSMVNRLTLIGVEKHTLANNYADIVWVNEQADKIYKNNLSLQEGAEIASFLAPSLYWLLKNKKQVSDLHGQDITKIMDDYYSDVYRLNPLTQVDKIPEGYTSLSNMLGSDYFAEQTDYNKQFTVYKEKYSAYDASELARNVLLFSGLSLTDMLKRTKKRLRFEVKTTDTDSDRMPGELLFIQLQDDRWIFFSLFPGAVFSKIFTAKEMQGNVFLKEISELKPTAKFSFDEYLELYSNRFLEQHAGMGMGIFKARWAAVNEHLIKPTLYSPDSGLSYPSPFMEKSNYGIIYHGNINATQPDDDVVSLLNTSLRDVLKNSAEARRKELYTPSLMQKIAFVLVPFYHEIYHTMTNPEYEVDLNSILLDVVGVVFVAVSAGIQIATVIHRMKSITELLRQGVKNGLSGKILQLYVIKEIAKDAAFSALKITKISITALIDLIDPLALKEISTFTIHHFNKSKNLRLLIPDATPAAQVRGINKKYARADVSLDDMQKQMLNGGEVYSPSSFESGRKEYYIAADGDVYQVRWDDSANTWRTMDPKNPGRFAYGEPVAFETGEWKINKAYGGLRGGGKVIQENSDVVIEIQQIRRGLKEEKVLENLSGGTEFNADDMLEKLKEVGEIAQSIAHPKGKCEYVSSYVALFLIKEKFKNIRYRGMAFFINGFDKSPLNHYVVVARKVEGGPDYVFDLTAAQFGGIYHELNGPIILPEEVWAQKYANLTSRSLIKYGDYKDRASAVTDFGPYSNYFYYGPNSLIPNAWVLLRPNWYYPGVNMAEAAAGVRKTVSSPGLGFPNAVRAAARRGMFNTFVSDVSWDYAVDVLENAELLSRGPAEELRKGIKRMVSERSSGTTRVSMQSLFSRTQPIENSENLLRVRQGDLLLFNTVDPHLPDAGSQPFHIMVGIGNGRFTGVKNSVLDPALGDSKKIITAEQLGEFKENAFRRRGGDTAADIQLIAAEPRGIVRDESATLFELAEQAMASTEDTLSALNASTELLWKSGEFAPEQMIALRTHLTPLLKFSSQQTGGEITRSVNQFFIASENVGNSADLAALPKGKMVIFGDPGSTSFSAHHLMYSLGEGNFMMVNPTLLDPRLKSTNALVKANQFPDDLFSKFGVQAGELSLSDLRMTSLLGRDASFFAEGPKLTIRLHGAASNVNYMDANELSEVIKGMALREQPPIKLAGIREIHLESCFGAFGRLPTGKALAALLDKKVVAYPLRFSEKIRNNPSILNRARTYLPGELSHAERVKIAEQNSLNHDFWNKLLARYRAAKSKIVKREADPFTDLINNVADFVNGDIDERVLMEEYPAYLNGLYATRDEFDDLCSGEINNAEDFAERCMDILTLSAWSADLLDKYLGGTGSAS